MTSSLNEIVANARTGTGPCNGCPATHETREDGHSRSEGVNPGLGHYDADVMFVTIEPSPPHGKVIDWETYDWTGYNDRYYDLLLENWDSGEAVREIIAPVDSVTTSDVWVADSIKCPPLSGEDDQKRTDEFEHCRGYLGREIEEVDPRVVVALGNRPATRTLDMLDGPLYMWEWRRKQADDSLRIRRCSFRLVGLTDGCSTAHLIGTGEVTG